MSNVAGQGLGLDLRMSPETTKAAEPILEYTGGCVRKTVKVEELCGVVTFSMMIPIPRASPYSMQSQAMC